MPITHGELFAGISGFGLGFDKLGIKTVWHVEIDRNCQTLLRDKYPNNLILQDVMKCGKLNLPEVDIISFGSPCQDLSIAGKREGIKNGKRSNLFFEAIRIVGELKPTFAVWENVPGALSSNAGRDFAAILAAFRECGARDIAWRILDSRYFGVAQRRRRVFLVADFRGERSAKVLFESEGLQRNIEESGETGKNTSTYAIRLAQTSSNGWGIREEETGTLDNSGGGAIVSNPIGSHHPRNDLDNDTYVAHALNAHPSATGRLDPSEGDFIPTISTSLGHHGWGIGDQDFKTLRSSQIGVRRLTPTECERLQGFPDDFTKGFSDSIRYRMLGNAVTVPVIEWIGKQIMEALK